MTNDPKNPDSDTPESDAMWIHCVRNSGPMSGIRMHLKMQELERARDLARRGIDCAINGIGLMGEVPYDCREERDHHAKKIIERLEGYLISPLNDNAPAVGRAAPLFCRAVVTFIDFGDEETEVQCFQWSGKRTKILTASIPDFIHRWPGTLAVCQASIEAEKLECKDWEEGSQQTPEELEKWWLSLSEPNERQNDLAQAPIPAPKDL